MTNIVRSLSFNISQIAYPMISYLYNIFELISKNQYFSSESIERLSGNIYIVISVCMLFTLGLKLLTAIVNPEALTDSGGGSGKGVKRTAKNVFFSILFSVFLIILIPFGFKYLYQIQADILDRQVVEKIVLGADTSEDHAPGQILASYAFASFCRPNETVSVETISNDGGNLYNLAITENIEHIKDMDVAINSKTNGEYDLKYNWILSPAVGVFLAYEMVLTCIDIALRSIKLALLELITAVVLCAYIVSGTDILKRWAQEVFKTYINVFLKVAAMSFMVYGLSLLENFLDSLNFEDTEAGFWSRGLIRVFVIIGLLQMVKQIPNFINTIFGTNIQSRGGIRGRLGEMAAVGQIAQQGWDKIRNKAIGFGALAAAGPAGWLGAGAALAGGAAIKHGWEKGFGGKAPWKDTKGGRALRHVGGVGKGIWTGAKSSKGIVGSISEGVKAYKDTEIAKSAAGAKDTDKIDKIVTALKSSFGVGLDGRLSDVIAAGSQAKDDAIAQAKANGKTDDEAKKIGAEAEKKARTIAARKAYADSEENVKQALKDNGATDYQEQVEKLRNASRTNELAKAARAAYENIDSQLSSLKDNTNDANIQKKIMEIQGDFRKGDISSADVVARLKSEAHFQDKEIGGIKVDSDNLSNVLDTKVRVWNSATGEFDEKLLGEALGQKAGGGFNISDIKNESSAMETVYNNVKSDITSAMDKNNATEFQKLAVNKTIEYIDLTSKTVADTAKKWNG